MISPLTHPSMIIESEDRTIKVWKAWEFLSDP